MSQFPPPPVNLADLPGWLSSAIFLVPFLLIFYQWNIFADMTIVAKGAIGFAVVTIIGWVSTAIAPYLTPDVIQKLQPYYAQLLIGLYAVLGVLGIQLGIRWYQDFRKARRAWFAATLASITQRQPDEAAISKFVLPRKG